MGTLDDIWDAIIDVKKMHATPTLVSITEALSEDIQQRVKLSPRLTHSDINTIFGIPLEVDDSKVVDPRGFAVWFS